MVKMTVQKGNSCTCR